MASIDLSIPKKLAVKYAFKTGMDMEYLLGEALEAYWIAMCDPTYDPRKSAFSTFAYIVVNSRMMDVEYKHRRERSTPTIELDEQMGDGAVSVERECYFNELLRQLPSDGRFIVWMVLGNRMDGIAPHRVRSTIRKTLRPTGWTASRIDKAFQSVSDMLKEVEAFA
jgi:hypothetical protein